MPRQERSAGFILFRLDEQGTREFLLLDYGRHWDYAKGHVEKGESDLDAAIRELNEETGIKKPDVIEGFTHEIEYFFRSSKHGLIKKSVIFFLARTESREVILSDEHIGFAFLDYDAAMKRLTYANARDALLRAHEFLEPKATK